MYDYYKKVQLSVRKFNSESQNERVKCVIINIIFTIIYIEIDVLLFMILL